MKFLQIFKCLGVILLVLFSTSCATNGLNSGSCDTPYSEYSIVEFVDPTYPLNELEKGVEGWVIVSLTINESGESERIMVLESDPNTVFDAAAIQAASRFRFSPRVIGCRPVTVENIKIKINFFVAQKK